MPLKETTKRSHRGCLWGKSSKGAGKNLSDFKKKEPMERRDLKWATRLEDILERLKCPTRACGKTHGEERWGDYCFRPHLGRLNKKKFTEPGNGELEKKGGREVKKNRPVPSGGTGGFRWERGGQEEKK